MQSITKTMILKLQKVRISDSWNNTFSYYDLKNTGCNKILAYKYGELIYIVWSEVRVSGWGYDSHFIRFTPSVPSWSEYKNVTDNEDYGGDEPDLTFSPDRVHVSFIKYQFSEPKTRDRSSGTWQTSQSVPFDYLPFTTSLRKGKPIISSNYLNEMYRADYASIGTEGSYIGHSYRSLGSSTWNQNLENLFTPVNKIHVVNNTINNRIHIIYYDEQAGNYVHKYLTGTTYSNVIANVPLFEQSSFLSSNSNDLYLLRVNNPDYPSKIKFRHYDDAPAAPQNLSVIESENNHPLLSWNANQEPDLSNYQVWKKGGDERGDWHLKQTTSNSSYEDPDERVVTGPKQGNEGTAYYYVKAVDLGSNVSNPSNEVNIRVGIEPPSKSVSGEGQEGIIYDYSLSQNFPNPFNPTTTIKYAIKTAGEVTLKVFDMLGTEVSSLVNENQEEGSYSVTFNASELPSGIYFYTLTSGNFIDTKKLILLK
jgi:hypothetical protein